MFCIAVYHQAESLIGFRVIYLLVLFNERINTECILRKVLFQIVTREHFV